MPKSKFKRLSYKEIKDLGLLITNWGSVSWSTSYMSHPQSHGILGSIGIFNVFIEKFYYQSPTDKYRARVTFRNQGRCILDSKGCDGSVVCSVHNTPLVKTYRLREDRSEGKHLKDLYNHARGYEESNSSKEPREKSENEILEELTKSVRKIIERGGSE